MTDKIPQALVGFHMRLSIPILVHLPHVHEEYANAHAPVPCMHRDHSYWYIRITSCPFVVSANSRSTAAGSWTKENPRPDGGLTNFASQTAMRYRINSSLHTVSYRSKGIRDKSKRFTHISKKEITTAAVGPFIS